MLPVGVFQQASCASLLPRLVRLLRQPLIHEIGLLVYGPSCYTCFYRFTLYCSYDSNCYQNSNVHLTRWTIHYKLSLLL